MSVPLLPEKVCPEQRQRRQRWDYGYKTVQQLIIGPLTLHYTKNHFIPMVSSRLGGCWRREYRTTSRYAHINVGLGRVPLEREP